MKTAEEKQATRDARNARRRERAAVAREEVKVEESPEELRVGNSEPVDVENIPVGDSFILGGESLTITGKDERKRRVYAQCSSGPVIIGFGNKVGQ